MANNQHLQSEILSTLKAIKNELERGRTTNDTDRGFNDSGLDFETEKKARKEWDKRQHKKYSWEEQQKEKYWSLVKQGKQGEANKVASKVGKTGVAQLIAGEVQKVSQEVINTIKTLAQLEYEGKKISLKYSQEIAKTQFQLIGKSLEKSISVATGGLVNSMQENSFKSTQNAIEIGKEFMLANVDISKAQWEKVTQLEILSWKKIGATVNATVGEAGKVLSSIPNPYTMIAGTVASIANGIFQATTDLEVMQLEYKMSVMDKEKEWEKMIIENVANITKNFSDLAQATDKLLMNLDTQANNTARMFGFSGRETENYVRAAAVLNKEMAVMGKTFEDLNKMQSAYISESGRNVLMNGKEGQMMSAFGKLYNISDEESAQIMGAMNIFNTSIESGSDIMFEMYKTANRMGVSNQKFAKDMQKNLKIAEKYQFKGGVKGMMDMALWAQKTRFNMDSLSGALEKMHTGDIADVIQTSAKLNVLGGNAAILSDPMAMLYNAYANPAQYAKNMQQMIQGFGHFNSKTGETEFNINEQMRMEAMASALGVSKEDFFNMARQEKKLGNIKKVLGGRFSSDETDFITQNATFNKDTGQWEVNVMGANGELQRRDINTLTQEELDSIFPEDNQQQLVEYTKGIFSILEKNTATDYKYRSELAYRTQGAHSKKYENIRGSYDKHYSQYMDLYAGETNEWFKFDADAMEAQLTQAEEYLKEGVLGDQFREKAIMGIQEQTGKISDYTAALKAMMETNMEVRNKLLVEAISKFDPDLAVEFKKVLDEQGDLVEYNKMMIDGTLTRDEVEKIMGSEAMKTALTKDFGVAGRTDLDILSHIKNGDWVVKNNDIQTVGGKQLLVNSTSLNAEAHNRKVNKAEYWQDFGIDLGNVVSAPVSGIGQLTGMDKKDLAKLRAAENGLSLNLLGQFLDMLNIKRTNDLIISPKHGIYETDPEDTIVASKPGGSLDRSSQRRGGLSDNVTLNITGSLTLSNGGQKIDLMELLRNDPNALRELTKEIIKEGSNTVFGGKHEWAPNRYTFS